MCSYAGITDGHKIKGGELPHLRNLNQSRSQNEIPNYILCTCANQDLVSCNIHMYRTHLLPHLNITHDIALARDDKGTYRLGISRLTTFRKAIMR